jgi:hypothetical protein
MRIAVAVAAVAALAIIGTRLLPGSPTSGGSDPSQTPSGPVVASASAAPLPTSGSLEPGTYSFLDLAVAPGRLTLTLPSGWEVLEFAIFGKNVKDDEFFDVALSTWIVGNVYADPCHWRSGTASPPVGPSVEDLATALVDQGGPGTPESTAVTVSGYDGRKVELSLPEGLDITTCDEGNFARWQPADYPDGYGGYIYGAAQHDAVYILDVAGERLVIDTMYLPGTPQSDLAELEAIVSSIRIEP